ncbi:unnamed protein product [Fraxinus pennsylvanica]|uniref:Uncharacterized protein n=1 Tax=Fraxinus pennsylvanica TaxID=56036 RepID=A0AAD1ZS99_9LAMI|nr:unnamed protein product [Fraxinus pennsylvanica]
MPWHCTHDTSQWSYLGQGSLLFCFGKWNHNLFLAVDEVGRAKEDPLTRKSYFDRKHYQIEAALPLVENLIKENAELVEKVNELYSELEQRGSKMELSSSVGSNPMGVIPQSANVADTSAIVMHPTVGTADKFGTAYSTDSTSEAEMESDEIVQTPLDENEVMDASDIEAGQND